MRKNEQLSDSIPSRYPICRALLRALYIDKMRQPPPIAKKLAGPGPSDYSTSVKSTSILEEEQGELWGNFRHIFHRPLSVVRQGTLMPC